MIAQEKSSTAVLPSFFKVVQKAEESIRLSAYHLLRFWRIKLNTDQVEFIIKKITEVPFEELRRCELDLLHNLNGRTTITSCLTNRIMWFVSDYIIYDSQNPGRDVTGNHLLDDLFEKWNDEQGHIELLCECVHNFKKVGP